MRLDGVRVRDDGTRQEADVMERRLAPDLEVQAMIEIAELTDEPDVGDAERGRRKGSPRRDQRIGHNEIGLLCTHELRHRRDGCVVDRREGCDLARGCRLRRRNRPAAEPVSLERPTTLLEGLDELTLRGLREEDGLEIGPPLQPVLDQPQQRALRATEIDRGCTVVGEEDAHP
jgi:hypothetical protein